jgi:DNA-binding transcriptional LysR family regulator
MIIDPRHLEHLAVIVELGTLQKAASKLGTSQPALSRTISNLEARIGTALFERTTRPLKPTPIGLELAQQGEAIKTARLRATEMVDLGARGYFGVLKVGAPPFLCKNLISGVIANFLSARPNIRIDLFPDYHAGLMERLYLNQLDVVVGPAKFAELGNTELTLVSLFKDANVIVGRKGHPLTSAASLDAEDLRSVTWVGHSDRSLLRADMEDALKLLGVTSPQVAFQSGSAEAVLELLRETDFLTILPRYAVKADGSDDLAILDLDLPIQKQEVSTITLVERTETTLVKDFKEHLRQQVSAQYESSANG